MAPRLDLEEFLPLSLPFFFLVEKWSRAINGRIISRASSAGEIRRIPRPRPYIREDPPGIGCYTPTSRPTCVRVNDAPPTLKYAPRWTKIRGRFSIGRADSLVTYSSSFLCNLEKLPFLVLFKSSSSFFLNFEDHFLLPIFFRLKFFVRKKYSKNSLVLPISFFSPI